MMKAGHTLKDTGMFQHVGCTNHPLRSTTSIIFNDLLGQDVHGSRPRVGNSLHQVVPGDRPACRVLRGTRYQLSEGVPGRENTVVIDAGTRGAPGVPHGDDQVARKT